MSQAPKESDLLTDQDIKATIKMLTEHLNDLNEFTGLANWQLREKGFPNGYADLHRQIDLTRRAITDLEIILANLHPKKGQGFFANMFGNPFNPTITDKALDYLEDNVKKFAHKKLIDKLNTIKKGTKIGEGFFGSSLTPYQLHEILTRPIYNKIHPTIEEIITGNGGNSSKPVNTTRVEVKPNIKKIEKELDEVVKNMALMIEDPSYGKIVAKSPKYKNGEVVPVEDFLDRTYVKYLIARFDELNQLLKNFKHGQGLTTI